MLGNGLDGSILGNLILFHLVTVVALDACSSRGGVDKSVLVVSEFLALVHG